MIKSKDEIRKELQKIRNPYERRERLREIRSEYEKDNEAVTTTTGPIETISPEVKKNQEAYEAKLAAASAKVEKSEKCEAVKKLKDFDKKDPDEIDEIFDKIKTVKELKDIVRGMVKERVCCCNEKILNQSPEYRMKKIEKNRPQIRRKMKTKNIR